jgi:hypothetical protein
MRLRLSTRASVRMDIYDASRRRAVGPLVVLPIP